MNKLFLISGIIAASFTAFSSAAFAEGSADLVDKGGYRPYLEWSSKEYFGVKRKSVVYVYAKQGETVYFGSSVNSTSTDALRSIVDDNASTSVNVPETYAGSTIAVTLPSSADGMPYDPAGRSDYEFRWRSYLDPEKNNTINYGDTGIYLVRPNTYGQGLIENRYEEMAGPNISSGDSLGYIPFSFTAPLDGTYAFRFLSSGYGGDSNPTAASANMEWNESDSTVAAWDVTVADSSGEIQTGRVWSDMLYLNTGAHQTPINSEVYVLAHDGFEYSFDLNGIEPFGFALYSNNRGALFDMGSYSEHGDFSNLQLLTHSFLSYSSDGDLGDGPQRDEVDFEGNPFIGVDGNPMRSEVLTNFTPVDAQRDVRHKIFLNTPSNDAVSAYTQNGSLVTNQTTINVPEANPEVTYSGWGSAAYNDEGVDYGTKGLGGEFTVHVEPDKLESKDTTTYRIVLDFSGYKLDEKNAPVLDGDGNWQKNDGTPTEAEKNNIVILSKVLVGSDDEIYWDGQDAYRNDVPDGVYSVGKAYWEIGSAHFPLVDVEYNPNGVKIQRLNSGMTSDTVYYNNQADNDNEYQAWYYAGLGGSFSGYPSKIGDGENHLSGISSADGAMRYDAYENEGDTYPSSTGKGYGNYTLLDIWSDYLVDSTTDITIGVSSQAKPLWTDEPVNAIVSFVSQDENSAGVTPFMNSHITDYNAENPSPVTLNSTGGENGNTISTGFTSTLSGNPNNLSYIKWDITIPVSSNNGSSYIKIPESTNTTANPYSDELQVLLDEIYDATGVDPDEATDQEVSIGSDGEIEDLGSDPSYAEEEFDSVPELTSISLYDAEGKEYSPENSNWEITLNLKNEPAVSDNGIENGGSIYEITGIRDGYTQMKLSFTYKLPYKISGGGDCVYGIIISDIYAPDATATAAYDTDTDKDYQDITNDIASKNFNSQEGE